MTAQSLLEGPHLRALEAKAICAAFAAFHASAPKADLRHYAVYLGKEDGKTAVTFLPDPGPGEEFLAGGETAYGACVTYILAPKTFKVIGKHYGK